MDQPLETFENAYYQLEGRGRPPHQQRLIPLSVELAYLASEEDKARVRQEYLDAKFNPPPAHEPIAMDKLTTLQNAVRNGRKAAGLPVMEIQRAVDEWHVRVLNRAVAMLEAEFQRRVNLGQLPWNLDPLLVFAVRVCRHERNAEFMLEELQATALLDMAYGVAIGGAEAAIEYGSIIAGAAEDLR